VAIGVGAGIGIGTVDVGICIGPRPLRNGVPAIGYACAGGSNASGCSGAAFILVGVPVAERPRSICADVIVVVAADPGTPPALDRIPSRTGKPAFGSGRA
jgi:hypothetical protein